MGSHPLRRLGGDSLAARQRGEQPLAADASLGCGLYVVADARVTARANSGADRHQLTLLQTQLVLFGTHGDPFLSVVLSIQGRISERDGYTCSANP